MGQSFSFSSVSPEAGIAQGDRIRFTIAITKTPPSDATNPYADVFIRATFEDGKVTDTDLASGWYVGPSGTAQTTASSYTAPPLLCSDTNAGCPKTPRSLGEQIQRLSKLQMVVRPHGRTGPEVVKDLGLYAPQVQITPTSQPLYARRQVTVTVAGANMKPFPNIHFYRNGDATGCNPRNSGISCYFTIFSEMTLSSPSVATFPFETVGFYAYLTGDEANARAPGPYDVLVRWDDQTPLAGASAPRTMHAVLLSGYNITAPENKDSVKVTSIEGVIDYTNANPAKRIPFVWKAGEVNTVTAAPGTQIRIDRATGTYRQGKYSSAMMIGLFRKKGYTKGEIRLKRSVSTTWEADLPLEDDPGNWFLGYFTVPPAAPPQWDVVIGMYLHTADMNIDYGEMLDADRAFASSQAINLEFKTGAALPYAPDPSTDYRFIGSNKTACVTKAMGPVKIPVKVTRVIGEVDGVGALAEAGAVIGSGVLAPTTLLRLPVYHRNQSGSSLRPRNRVLLNGKDIGPGFATREVDGQDDVWTLASFEVPSSLVRFGRRIPGAAPAAGENEITIEGDANPLARDDDWCISTDWAEMTVRALYPVIMVHGNGQGDDKQGGLFWDGFVLGDKDRLQLPFKFTQPFIDQKIPYDNTISMTTDTIQVHGDELGKLIPALAAEFGARHVHLVAHSKGGLDSRDFLARTLPKNLGVLSLTTVSTPHRGSPGPDYQLDAVGADIPSSDDSTHTYLGSEIGVNKGTSNLRVSFVEAFNARNIPLLPKQLTVDGETLPVAYRAVAADANVDDSYTIWGNPTISYEETLGLPGQKEGKHGDTKWAYVIEQCYRIVGTVVSTRTETIQVTIRDHETKEVLGVKSVKVVRETLTKEFRPNDVAVSRFSAVIDPFVEIGFVKANHSTIAGPDVARLVIKAIREIQPIPKQ